MLPVFIIYVLINNSPTMEGCCSHSSRCPSVTRSCFEHHLHLLPIETSASSIVLLTTARDNIESGTTVTVELLRQNPGWRHHILTTSYRRHVEYQPWCQLPVRTTASRHIHTSRWLRWPSRALHVAGRCIFLSLNLSRPQFPKQMQHHSVLQRMSAVYSYNLWTVIRPDDMTSCCLLLITLLNTYYFRSDRINFLGVPVRSPIWLYYR